MADHQDNQWVLQAFVEAHPQWGDLQQLMSVSEQQGWHSISLQGIPIGRVKIEGRKIIAEALIGYTKLG